tara:strand:+ start:23223 stop:24143 length:921 start_codon:yes stop_codon:yes gene_type:complete
MKNTFLPFIFYCLLALFGCSKNKLDTITDGSIPNPGTDIVQLPVVIHMIHDGEDVGEGANLSKERVLRQIEILNEDFRRKVGTNGFNDHPDGADTKIEFVLAQFTPDFKRFNGINRIDTSKKPVDNLGYNQNHYAQFAFWPPDEYINIWVTPLPLSSTCLALGVSSGPDIELPGSELFSVPQDDDAEGILINWIHFGESNIDCHAKLGRTLTHEMGHYLGLLHTWGGRDCAHNDYCDDTPAVNEPIFGSKAILGCDGEAVMIGNYMNYSDDAVMNIFTKDQAERMYYVLRHHAGRKGLMTSTAIER